MEKDSKSSIHSYRNLNIAVLGIAFIVVGFLYLLNSWGLVSNETIRVIISWPMFFIVLGILSFIKQHKTAGFTLIFIGGFFLIKKVLDVNNEVLRSYWPVAFILLGIFLLLRIREKEHRWRHGIKEPDMIKASENGYISSDISFGGGHFIVLDPEFKGATLKVCFGGVKLDLRNTKLVQDITYINIDAVFGGIELYIPSSWHVITRITPRFGGLEDKRFLSVEMQDNKRLVIQGNLHFGGIEIKN